MQLSAGRRGDSTMLAKMIPLALVGALGIKGMTMGKDQLVYFQNYSKISVTQQEVANIHKMIMVEIASEGEFPADWQEIVRVQTDAGERDPCVDIWGFNYEVWQAGDQGELFTVGSPGPDGAFSTEDDILTKN